MKAVSLSAGGGEASSKEPEFRMPMPASGKPNILIIVSDQHRAGLSKRSGYPIDTSPTLDSLAMHGVGCDRAYATCPVCMPSRTTMLTGRWPEAHRVRQNSGVRDAYFEKDIFDVVKAVGYKTGLAGKNHTYLKPEKLDFWRQYTIVDGWKSADAPKDVVEYDQWLKRMDRDVSHHPTPFPVETQLSYRIVSDAITFMERSGDQPFALEVSFPGPHNPYQVPKPYWDMYPPDQVPPRRIGPEALKDKGFKWQWQRGLENDAFPSYDKYWRRLKSNYLGMLRLLDDQLARLTGFMRRRGLLEKTILVYVADHGDYLTEYGLMRKGVGMPEALIRIPMVWSGWGIQRGRPHEKAFVSMADVMPTLCEAIGADIPRGVQGRSLWPILQGKDYSKEEFRSICSGVGFGGLYYDASDHVPFTIAEKPYPGPGGRTFDELNAVSQSGYAKMVRMGDWKLIYDMMGYGQLYHLQSDPCEMKNLFGDPSVANEQARLMAELAMWTIRIEDTLPTDRYKAKWPGKHNWYAPHRHGTAPRAFIP